MIVHSEAQGLNDPATWLVELGLMPVPLFSTTRETSSYVLLNGAKGNLCLGLGDTSLGATSRNHAWSANVGHYVLVSGEDVLVQRWDRGPSTVERYQAKTVRNNLDSFHKHIESHAPDAHSSVVAHAVQIFRTLRATLGKKITGHEALRTYLYLLASVTDKADRGDLSLSRWGLRPEAAEIAFSLNATEWQNLSLELARGRLLDRLQPDLELMLRHAAGLIFQEAHYAALFVGDDQLLFPGVSPPPVTIASETEAIGLHFTPPSLARALAEQAFAALGNLPKRLVVFDPACGSGEFFRETLRWLQSRDFRGAVHLIGFDVSQSACDMAEFVLAWEKRTNSLPITFEIRCCDAMHPDTEWPRGVDVVLMNPPFRSWRDMGERQRDVVKSVLGNHASMRPDLAAAFLWRAIDSVGDTAVLATILPASLLDGESYKMLRSALGERLKPQLLARLGSHDLFHAARVDAGLYVAGRGLPSSTALAFWADYRPTSSSAALRTLRRVRALPGSENQIVDRDGYSIYPTASLGTGSQSWAPRPYKEWRLLSEVTTLPPVSSTFVVRQGVLTGLNKAFILDRTEWLRLAESEQAYFRPAVLNESVREGRLIETSYVFYPYGSAEISDETTLRQVVPSYFQSHLVRYKSELLARARVRPDRWWQLTEYRAWQVKHRPKIVSAYFGDVGSFAWDEKGSFAVVQGYAWLPERRLSRNAWLAYLALLNSGTFSSLLAATSNHVGGGQWNLSKRFVEKIPLPKLPSDQYDIETFKEISSLGEIIHRIGLAGLSLNNGVRLGELAEAIYATKASI